MKDERNMMKSEKKIYVLDNNNDIKHIQNKIKNLQER